MCGPTHAFQYPGSNLNHCNRNSGHFCYMLVWIQVVKNELDTNRQVLLKQDVCSCLIWAIGDTKGHGGTWMFLKEPFVCIMVGKTARVTSAGTDYPTVSIVCTDGL